MINLELAQKLKSAGLVWEPKKFDLYNAEFANGSSGIFSVWHDGQVLESMTGTKFIWLPSLSQLLAEIEKGYSWETGLTVTKGGPMMPGERKSGYWAEIFKNNKSVYSVEADTPEDAAASALLWILERDKDG